MRYIITYVEWALAITIVSLATAGLLLILFFAALGLLTLVGCTSVPTKQFNTEDQQDGSCYATTGGKQGYCTK